MTRRDVLWTGAAAMLWAGDGRSNKLGMEAYIFQQYAQRQGKRLGEVLTEVIPMAKAAGFENIELNAEFFTPELKQETLDLIRSNKLRMPTVYSGGPMHEPGLADQTIQKALAIGKVCQPFGCAAVVINANPKGENVEKTDRELAIQAESFNRMGRILSENGLQLRVHNHTPEMLSGAREWHYTLQHTDPKYVAICLDLDWVHQGGQDPLALLKLAGKRVAEVHVRDSHQKLWLEDLEPGDIDYPAIAAYLAVSNLQSYIVVELAYRKDTVITRPLTDDLRISREYAERIFRVKS